mmetsp:Transcript_11964/g.21361  ORF Transcript_11964/g.21361 Transcript_11964/m.21361 type:complete len:109 (-) Transcript_11964:933-1259(-)
MVLQLVAANIRPVSEIRMEETPMGEIDEERKKKTEVHHTARMNIRLDIEMVTGMKTEEPRGSDLEEETETETGTGTITTTSKIATTGGRRRIQLRDFMPQTLVDQRQS